MLYVPFDQLLAALLTDACAKLGLVASGAAEPADAPSADGSPHPTHAYDGPQLCWLAWLVAGSPTYGAKAQVVVFALMAAKRMLALPATGHASEACALTPSSTPVGAAAAAAVEATAAGESDGAAMAAPPEVTADEVGSSEASSSSSSSSSCALAEPPPGMLPPKGGLESPLWRLIDTRALQTIRAERGVALARLLWAFAAADDRSPEVISTLAALHPLLMATLSTKGGGGGGAGAAAAAKGDAKATDAKAADAKAADADSGGQAGGLHWATAPWACRAARLSLLHQYHVWTVHELRRPDLGLGDKLGMAAREAFRAMWQPSARSVGDSTPPSSSFGALSPTLRELGIPHRSTITRCGYHVDCVVEDMGEGGSPAPAAPPKAADGAAPAATAEGGASKAGGNGGKAEGGGGGKAEGGGAAAKPDAGSGKAEGGGAAPKPPCKGSGVAPWDGIAVIYLAESDYLLGVHELRPPVKLKLRQLDALGLAAAPVAHFEWLPLRTHDTRLGHGAWQSHSLLSIHYLQEVIAAAMAPRPARPAVPPPPKVAASLASAAATAATAAAPAQGGAKDALAKDVPVKVEPPAGEAGGGKAPSEPSVKEEPMDTACPGERAQGGEGGVVEPPALSQPSEQAGDTLADASSPPATVVEMEAETDAAPVKVETADATTGDSGAKDAPGAKDACAAAEATTEGGEAVSMDVEQAPAAPAAANGASSETVEVECS